MAVFVDGANLYHPIESHYKAVLDYFRLLQAATGDRELLRATFYIVEKHGADEPKAPALSSTTSTSSATRPAPNPSRSTRP